MISIESKIRQWGRSLGVVIPKEGVEKGGFRADDAVTLLITKKSDAVKRTFNSFKFKKSTDELLNEIDREAWSE